MATVGVKGLRDGHLVRLSGTLFQTVLLWSFRQFWLFWVPAEDFLKGPTRSEHWAFYD